MPLVHTSDAIDGLTQPSIKKSELIHGKSKFRLKGSCIGYRLVSLVLISSIRLPISLWPERCCIVVYWKNEHLLVKKNERNKCAGKRFWSYPIALEILSDHNSLFANPPLIRQSRLKCGGELFQTMYINHTMRRYAPAYILTRRVVGLET